MMIGDYGASVIRTVVSYLWGLLVTAALNAATGAPAELAELLGELAGWLGSDVTTGAVTVIAGAAWYMLWRRLEPRLPRWLTRITIGSARTPDHYRLAA